MRAGDVERKVASGMWGGGLRTGVGEPFAPERQTVGWRPRAPITPGT